MTRAFQQCNHVHSYREYINVDIEVYQFRHISDGAAMRNLEIQVSIFPHGWRGLTSRKDRTEIIRNRKLISVVKLYFAAMLVKIEESGAESK